MNSFKYQILKRMMHFCLRTKLNFGIYSLLLLTVKRENRSLNLKKDKRWHNEAIIVFDKTGLAEDLFQVSQYQDGEFPVLVIIPRYMVNILAEFYLDARQRQDFLPNQEYNENSHFQYQRLWSFLLPRLSRRFKTRILITANYTYGNQRDIYEVASGLGWAVVVLLKECFMSEANSRNRINLFKNSRPFSGTKMLVYNKSEIRRQLLSGNAQEHQIAVTGSPRFDQLILSSEKKVKPKDAKIIFFPPDYISEENFWQLSGEQIEFSACHNKQILFGLETILSLAIKYPEIKFEIKSKITLATREFISEWTRNKEIPHNITINLGGGLARNSLNNCIGAFGFNTTALVDALASGAKIAVLRHEIEPEKHANFLIHFESARVIQQYTDMEKWIEDIVSDCDRDGDYSLQLSSLDRKCLDNAVGNGDSKSSERVYLELKAIDPQFSPNI